MDGHDIIEPAVAPIIYADAIWFEVKPDTVWCHILTRHRAAEGEELHRQAIIVLTPENFAKALDDARAAGAMKKASH